MLGEKISFWNEVKYSLVQYFTSNKRSWILEAGFHILKSSTSAQQVIKKTSLDTTPSYNYVSARRKDQDPSLECYSALKNEVIRTCERHVIGVKLITIFLLGVNSKTESDIPGPTAIYHKNIFKHIFFIVKKYNGFK